jgi:hypothetical protein
MSSATDSWRRDRLFLSAFVLHALLSVRGKTPHCPASYDALLAPSHPLRRRLQAAMMTAAS